jgi:endonuclease I
MSDWDEAVTSMADVVARDFRSAFSEAADAKDRTYYDVVADEAAARAYYGEAGPEQLGELIRTTHRDTPRYKPSLELYPWVDLQPDGKLKSLYTAEIFEPEQLISADLVVLQERAARMIRLRGLEDGDSAALEAKVEAQLPFNCEHVVPQSWFEKHEPMRGDLHHLFACESRCNGFRGNTPFADFPDFPPAPPPESDPGVRAVRDDCGKSDSNGFEPAHGKGAAARAAFYFRLRYPEQISAEEMSDDRWPVLMTWHEQDPVSTWELHRNAAIAERQGNRNPFIDHPEWVSAMPVP